MGGSDLGSRASIEAIALGTLTVLLVAAAAYIPVIGVFVSLLAPMPLLLVGLRHGPPVQLLALALAGLSLALLVGWLQSLIFTAEYGVMAAVMAAAIRRRWSSESVLAVGTLGPLLASGVVAASLLPSVDLDVAAVRRHFEDLLAQALQPYLEGERPVPEELQAYIRETMGHVIRLLPALFVLSTAAGAAVNYGAVRAIWRRLAGPPLFAERSLAHWAAPEPCVWVLIAAGLAGVLPLPAVQTAGLNVLCLVGAVYLVQGLAIVRFYLAKASVPPVLRLLAYCFLLVQPLLLLGVAAFGLFDLWFDFRRLRRKREDSA
jgi:uncharacterized protein YybS (DUF2232 family)